jgi:hypothetical protein
VRAWRPSGRLAAATLAAAVAAATALVSTAPSTAVVAPPAAAEPAATTAGNGPVGWNTYRHLDQLPYLSSGVQTRQFSSFDRAGGNDDGGGGGLGAGGAGTVIAQDSGPGEIDDIWFTINQGDVTALGTIEIELDGTTVVDAPLQNVVNGGLGAPFQYPLVANASQSPGGVYLKVPMTYRSSMRVSIQQNPQYYHVAYRHFPDASGVSTFDPTDRAQDVLGVLANAGKGDPKPAAPGATTTSGTVSVPAGGTATVATLTGPGAVSALRLQLPGTPSPATLAGLRLRISFDGHATVDSPVGEFFGAGLGSTAIQALLFSAGTGANAWYSTWWPMPYAQNATITLANTTGTAVNGINTQVTTAPDSQWAAALAGGTAGYFSARSHSGAATNGQDWSFADTTGHGKFVGVSEAVHGGSGAARNYLEGDERVYTDGSLSPQVQGTGTEDFYEGGWYFLNSANPYSDAFTGAPAHETSGQGDCASDCTSMYRLMLGDSVGYDTALRFGIEHGEWDQSAATYSSTAFLYAQATAGTRRTDSLDVTDAGSRSAHSYSDSGTQAALTAQYEGEQDAMPLKGQVRSGTGAISFTLSVDSGNAGVLLRRTADQNAAYQSAAVSVDGTAVGTWLEARGNGRQRWLADTFALPAGATAGKSSVTVTLAPTSGAPAWTASRYVADSLVTPFADTTAPAAPTGLTLVNTRHAVRFQWPEPADDTGVRLYQVYSSPTPDVPVNSSTLLGTTRTTSFYRTMAAKLTRYYRVVAVDGAGNASQPSAVLAATGTARLHTDIDGDGRDDVLTFTRGTSALVYGATSTGTSFSGDGVRWGSGAAPNDAVPLTGDFNGDGRDDVVWFTRGTTADVYVQLSTGGGFAAPVKWHDWFCANSEIPVVGDFNGDGLDDIATFTRGATTPGDVYVALSTGSSFSGTGIKWDTNFGLNSEPPAVGDFNGDGLDDIATFAQPSAYVYVALSNGARFLGNVGESVWNTHFAPTGETPGVGDFTGDGKDDIVTFTQASTPLVWVGVSSGTSFGTGVVWHDHFSLSGEVPGVGDFDGDGKSDVVTFTRGTTAQVYVSLSDGTKFVQDGWLWHNHFCVGTEWPQPSRLLP